jgi:hypothetical protein
MLLTHGHGLTRRGLRRIRFPIERGAAIATKFRGSRILPATLQALDREARSTLGAESGAGRIFGAAA